MQKLQIDYNDARKKLDAYKGFVRKVLNNA